MEIRDYKTELKKFLKENLDQSKYEIFDIRQGFLIRYENKEPMCFKFSDVGLVKMLKEDSSLDEQKIFTQFVSKIKKEMKIHVRELKNKK